MDEALLREMRRQNAVVMYGLSGPDRWADGARELGSITSTLAHFLDVPYAGVHILDDGWQVTLAASHDDDPPPVPREQSVCSTVLDHEAGADLVVVPDTAAVTWLRDNPFVRDGEPPLRFYAAAPLRTRTGLALGTLCVASGTSRDLDESERALLLHLASAVLLVLDRGRPTARTAPGAAG